MHELPAVGELTCGDDGAPEPVSLMGDSQTKSDGASMMRLDQLFWDCRFFFARAQAKETMKSEKAFRSMAFDLTQRAATDDRAFDATLSSEEPYTRSWGVEILDHSDGAVNLARADAGMPLLFSHDPEKPIGMVEQLRIESRRLRARVRFFATPSGDEALTMVQGGLRSLSIGYTVDEMQQTGNEGELPVYTVKRWTLLEASLVTIPADATVGIGRSRSLKPISQKENRMTQVVSTQVELDRTRQLIKLGEQYSRWMTPTETRELIEAGATESQYLERVMARIQSKHTDVRSDIATDAPEECDRFSLGRAIVAQITNDWSKAGLERELSREIAKRTGRESEGFYVPSTVWGRPRMQRDFNVGTAAEAGNIVQTTLQSDMFLDALRNQLVLARLGVTVLSGLSGNVDLPRKSVASTLGMLTEIQAATETQPNTAKITLSPKRIGAFVEVSKQAMIQSAIQLESMIAADLLAGAAQLIEDQMLNGSGTGANMRGIRNTAGIGAVAAGTNGATVAWSHFTDLEAACATVNATPGLGAGYVTNDKVRNRAKNVQRGTNLTFIIDPDVPLSPDGFTRVNGYRTAFTNAVPSNLTKGTSNGVCSAMIFSNDWAMGVLGLFGNPDVVVDPYTLASTGQVRITLNQYADFGVRQPLAFAAIADMLT